jgi:putative aldouronate transport system substrate-binding protein
MEQEERNMKKFLSLFFCLIILAGIFFSCGKSAQPPVAAGSRGAGAASSEGAPEPLTLPITKEPVTLTVFAGLADRAAVSIKSYGEMAAFQELERRTGIDLVFHDAAVGQSREQFNLMLAANDMDDLIYYEWPVYFAGGPQKALDDNVILELGDLIRKYAPNFSEILANHDDVRRESITDSGSFYMMPLLKMDLADRVSGGFQIRKDWLDKLGLQKPTTIDEWYTVLKAFKEKDPNGNGKADEIPFINSKIVDTNGVERFSYAWGFPTEFYMENRIVKYGPMQPAFKEFLLTMRKWYTEELIDQDFLISDRKDHDSKVTSELGGAYYGLINSYMGTYTGVMKNINPAFDIREVPLPKAPDGKHHDFHTDQARVVQTTGFALASTNKHPVESIKLLDYFYSDEGRILMNLGIEGLTYKIENGTYVFTDLITKNPDGLPLDRAISKYTPAGTACRLYQDPRYWAQMMAYDNQREASKILQDNTAERVLPPITPTPEESSRLAAIQNEVNTYFKEMFAKFVMGQADIEKEFDTYLGVLKSLNVDEAIAIQQRALDRFYKR